jgi:glycolate oxidase
MLREDVARELISCVGREFYLDSPEDLINYSYDGFVLEAKPDAVVLPQTTEQVSVVMAAANRAEIPVTARGAGTNICAGTIPSHGGIVLALTGMNRILEMRPEDRLAVVQPGLVNADLQEAAAKVGLFFPPDPGSMSVSTIGGNVAENAGGPRGIKYGVTRDYVLGLTVVLADGRVFRTGGRTAKNVTGYDLTALFCGSEGTLGIITEIVLKLMPLPEAQRSLQALFPDLEGAGQTVAKIMSAGILPVAMELMDSVVVNLIEDSAHIGLRRDAEGTLLIMVDGPEGAIGRQLERIEEFCKANGAIDVQVARTPEENDAVWVARRSAFGVMARVRPNCIVEDVTVPVSRLPSMVRSVVEISKKYSITVGVLAHAGDGNMHPLILTDQRDQEEWNRVETATKEIFQRAVELGGTLSGEHGIGKAKEPYLHMVMNEDTIQIMRDIKKVFDPKGILNPGKFV